jgi:hypothetical protein
MRRILGPVSLLALALLSLAVGACNRDRSATDLSPYSVVDDPNRPGANSGGGGGGGGGY